jgi:hypothetical protein
MRRSVVVLVALLVAGAGAGCSSDPCKGIDGPGDQVRVWWAPTELPSAARFRLCVDGSCMNPVPHAIGVKYGDAGPYRAVEVPATRTHVKARFELLDESGRVTARFAGEGDLTGRCFKTASFRAQPGGTLSIAPVGDTE